MDIAQSIVSGSGNVGLGLEAAALNYGLSFIPLTLERYDLVFRTTKFDVKYHSHTSKLADAGIHSG